MASRRTKDDIVRTETIYGHTINYYRQQIETGEVLTVPTFIVRNSKLKGWQIRISRKLVGYFSKFYADGSFGESRKRSLAAVTKELRKLLRETNPQKQSGLRVREKKSKKGKLGIPGATYVWHLNKKRGIYELRINLRAGGERARPHFMKSIYVGTELTISEDIIRDKILVAARLRRQWTNDLVSIYGEKLKPRTGRPERINVDCDGIFEALAAIKERQADVLEEIVLRRVEDAMDGPETLQGWRGVSLKRKKVSLGEEKVTVPWFVKPEDGYWYYTFPLIDGSIYGDAIPISEDVNQDMREILAECMIESAKASRPIPRDVVHPDLSDRVSFTKIPMEVIQEMNSR
jgi:hypothetical protein